MDHHQLSLLSSLSDMETMGGRRSGKDFTRSFSADSGYRSVPEQDILPLSEQELLVKSLCRENSVCSSSDFVEVYSPVDFGGPPTWSGSRTSSPQRPPKASRVTANYEAHRRTLSALYDQYDGVSEETKPVLKAATLPRQTARSRDDINTRRVRPSLKSFNTESSVKSTGSLRTPDRFLPSRRPISEPVAQSFRVSKDPAKLSKAEKLLRNNDASQDAFNPRRRATSPMLSVNRSQARRNSPRGRPGSATILGFHSVSREHDPTSPTGQRQVSAGTIWSVGGVAPATFGVPNGRGRMISSGSNAPLYTTSFSAARSKTLQTMEQHEDRLASALELDRAHRIFEFREPSVYPTPTGPLRKRKHDDTGTKTSWMGTEWILGEPEQRSQRAQEARSLPAAPFKVLDAPHLRDDFYCSILAYSPTCHTLAVGLGGLLYGWSERQGVKILNCGTGNGAWLTSIAFSSTQGCKSILAFGRSDGTVSLMSLYCPTIPRFEVRQRNPIACIAWKPTITMRASRSPVNTGMVVKTEDLFVGDETGNVYCYAVEWPDAWEVSRDSWSGCMTLIAKISIHQQQICGLAFSPDGYLFATGGNDNLCCLFKTSTVLPGSSIVPELVLSGFDGIRRIHTIPDESEVPQIKSGAEKHRWVHGAAVKAIAFCPWRDGLVATGGGSNDKCIHFFHTSSGACLATISVEAQVTSLIWSTTRREIVATFGFAQPEHPYRIAIFSWPECKQVAAIRWEGEHRALYAIAYPGGPNESQTSREGGRGLTRTAKEGCIVVASSDESVKFHEVWSAGQKATTGGSGLLGGSDILEGLDGIDKELDIIR